MTAPAEPLVCHACGLVKEMLLFGRYCRECYWRRPAEELAEASREFFRRKHQTWHPAAESDGDRRERQLREAIAKELHP